MNKALIRVYFYSLLTFFNGGRNKKTSAVKKLLFILIFMYAFGTFGVMFYGMFKTLAKAYHILSLDWLFFCYFAVSCFAVCFIGSVFSQRITICYFPCP